MQEDEGSYSRRGPRNKIERGNSPKAKANG